MRGTHNSLSYANPKYCWRNLFRFAWKCQDKILSEQIIAGIRAFDIRVAIHNDKFCSAHGGTKLDMNPCFALAIIDRFCVKAYVRLTLETGYKDKDKFVKFCSWAENKYPSITFFGGTYKPTWEYLYKFNTPSVYEQTLYQHIGSMQSWWGKLFPRLWAKRHRHDIPEFANDDELPIVFLDFV